MISIREATYDDCLWFAGTRAPLRRYLVLMRSEGEAYLISDDQGAVALAFIIAEDDGARQFCLGLQPRARVHMREMCRAAQLILKRLADDGPINCYIVPENRAGVRMARIVGFSPDPDHRYRWTMGA